MMIKKYLSIDIGGTQIKYALIDRSGNIIRVEKIHTPDNLVDFLQIIDQVIGNVAPEIRGVSISCPGRVDSKEGVIYFGGALPYLHELNLPKYISEKFTLPAAVINDGKAAALSELWLGNLKDIENGAAVILGTGVGGGIIINGQLLLGEHFQAGELSFQTIPSLAIDTDDLAGMTCSAVKMIEKCAEKLGMSDLQDGVSVFEAINQKDARVYPIFEEYCRHIAYLIYNTQSVIDVKRYVVGGGISAQKIVVEEINRQFLKLHQSNELVQFMFSVPEIVTCAFRNEANLLGALYQLLLNTEQN